MALYHQAAKQSGGTEKINGATIVNGGSASSTETNVPALGTVIGGGARLKTGPKEKSVTNQTQGADVADRNGPGGAVTAKNSGTFAYDNQSGVVIGKRLASKINGVSNDTLLSGGVGKGARTRSSIHYVENVYPLPHYSYKSDGSINSKINSPGGVNASTGWNSTTSFIDPAEAGGATAAADSAARPTRAIPGELVYTDSSQAGSAVVGGEVGLAKQADYPAKTG